MVLGFAPDEEVNLASSETHTVNGSGSPTLAVRSTISPCGPCTDGPCSSKLSTGGVFPTAASLKGEISQSGLRLAGIAVVLPLATMVQVILLSPKSAGTFTVNSPQPRPGMKWVGWPRSGPPGSSALFGPTGNVHFLFAVSVVVAEQETEASVGILEPAFKSAGDAGTGVAGGLREQHLPERQSPHWQPQRSSGCPERTRPHFQGRGDTSASSFGRCFAAQAL